LNEVNRQPSKQIGKYKSKYAKDTDNKQSNYKTYTTYIELLTQKDSSK